MKKYISKPTAFNFSLLLALLIILVIIHSCKKDNKSVPTLNTAIAQAKVWYESTYPIKGNTSAGKRISQTSNGAYNLSQVIKPDWQHTSQYKKAGKNVIEMPVDPSVKFGFAAKIGNIATNKAYSRGYFLLLNDGKKYNAFIMMVLADSDYVKNDLNKLSHNTYQKNDADFSGKVLYFTPTGDYVGGYAYRNGSLVVPGQVIQQTGNPKVESIGSNLKPDKMVQQCTDWYLDYYIDGLFDHSVYIGRTCVSVDDGTGDGAPHGGGGTPPPPCAPPTPPIQDAINGGHLVVDFLPPPDPCAPVKQETQDTVLTDPCSGTKISAATNTNGFTNGNTSVAAAFNSAITYSNNNQEAAFHVDNVGSTFTASTPVATSPGAEYSSTTINSNTTAIGHSHDASSFPQPSPYDIFKTGELAVSHPSLKTNLVVSPTAKYAIVVTDVNAFQAFFNKYNESYLTPDGDFDDNKELGKDIDKVVGINAYTAYFSSHGLNEATATSAQKAAAEIAAEEASLTYFVGNYNTGITLLKADATGVFKPLHFTSTTINGIIVYTVSPCDQD